MQFDAWLVLLRVRRVGHRVAAPRAVAEDEFDVLAGVYCSSVIGRQLHLQDRTSGAGRSMLVTRGHLADRKLARAGHGAGFDDDVGLGRRLAGEDQARCSSSALSALL